MQLTTENIATMRRRMGTAPKSPREWTVYLDLPAGIEPSVSVPDVDALASELCPEGWAPTSATFVSQRSRTTAPTWTGWQVRLSYCPAEWIERYTPRAPLAAYAVAQLAGVRTQLDAVMTADYSGIQYRTPNGRPTMRICGDWTGDLPETVKRDIARLDQIDRLAAIGGHMRGRPDTARAAIIAADLDTADRRERTEIRSRLAAYAASVGIEQ